MSGLQLHKLTSGASDIDLQRYGDGEWEATVTVRITIFSKNYVFYGSKDDDDREEVKSYTDAKDDKIILEKKRVSGNVAKALYARQ